MMGFNGGDKIYKTYDFEQVHLGIQYLNKNKMSKQLK